MNFKKLNIIAAIVINILLAIFFILSISGKIGYDEGRSLLHALLLLNIFTFGLNSFLNKDDNNKISNKKNIITFISNNNIIHFSNCGIIY